MFQEEGNSLFKLHNYYIRTTVFSDKNSVKARKKIIKHAY